jgi:hypothetical protein
MSAPVEEVRPRATISLYREILIPSEGTNRFFIYSLSSLCLFSFTLMQPAAATAAAPAPAPIVFAAASADSPGRFGLELTFTNEKLIEMARDENGEEYSVR